MSTEYKKLMGELENNTEMISKLNSRMDTEVLAFINSLKSVYAYAQEMAEMGQEAKYFVDEIPDCEEAEMCWDAGDFSDEELDKYYKAHSYLCEEFDIADETADLFRDMIKYLNGIIGVLNSVPEWESPFEHIECKY